jgi:hypothetical protein
VEQTSRISPRAFSEKIISNSKKNKTKTNRLMGWIKNGLNKFSNQNFVRQTFPPKCICLVLDLSVSWWLSWPIYSKLRGGSPLNSKLRGGHFVGPFSIFGHKMTMYIRIYIIYSNIAIFDIFLRQLVSNMLWWGTDRGDHVRTTLQRGLIQR